MNNLMTAVFSTVAAKIIDPLIKKLFAAVWNRLMTNTFKATLKAMMNKYLPIVGSFIFTVLVCLNIWVYSRPAPISGIEAFWIGVYLLQLVLALFCMTYSLARLGKVERGNSDRGKLRWRDGWNGTHPAIPSSVVTICDERTRCKTVISPW
jgi:hypothetical protein